MATAQHESPREIDTYLRKGNRKVLVIGEGEATGYVKVLLPFTKQEAERARTNDRLGEYDARNKIHARRTNVVKRRVSGTILNVAKGNLVTKDPLRT